MLSRSQAFAAAFSAKKALLNVNATVNAKRTFTFTSAMVGAAADAAHGAMGEDLRELSRSAPKKGALGVFPTWRAESPRESATERPRAGAPAFVKGRFSIGLTQIRASAAPRARR